MQYELQNDVLMERDDDSQPWRPVPVKRLLEAWEAVSQPKRHAISASGKLTAKVVRGSTSI